MAADPDEDALSWSGETDPTHVATPVSLKKHPAETLDAAADRSSPVFLVVLGIFAGVYLLYTVGWGIHAFTHPVPFEVTRAGAFPAIMYQLGEFFSIASPLLWAGAVWLLVKKPVRRLLLLFIGVVLLVPLPFILGN